MAIKARSRATNKKTAKRAPKPGTTPVDRRLLAKAKQEEAEGKVVRLEVILASMLRRGAAGLDDALGLFIDAQRRVEHAPSEKALEVLFKLRDVRQLVLEVAEQMPAFGRQS